MADFETAVELILRHEGEFTLRRNDPGNWTGGEVGVGELKGTNLGISAAAYPNEDLRALTRERAKAIYRRDYWDAVRATELPHAVALVVFDMAVNAGVRAATLCLQRALRVADDGVLGPVTLAAAARQAGVALLTRITRERILYYASLRNWPSEKKGWTQRTLETLLTASDL